MLLAALAAGWKRRDVFAPARPLNNSTAQRELLSAALRHSSAEELHMFSTKAVSQPGALAAVERQIRDDLGTPRVKLQPILTFPELVRRRKYVFLADVFGHQGLAAARQATGAHAYPICASLLSVSHPLVVAMVFNLALFSQNYDAFVVTSQAASSAMLSLFEATCEFIARRFECKSLSLPRVSTIPLGIDPDFMSPRDRNESRAMLGLPMEAMILLQTLPLAPESAASLEPMMAAMRASAEIYPDALLVIATPDSAPAPPAELLNMARAFDLENRIMVLPSISLFSKPFVYSAADIFVCAKRNLLDTFGVNVLEAMACGVPVIATNWGSHRDIVEDGKTGFLIPTEWSDEAGDAISPISAAYQQGRAEQSLERRTGIDVQAMAKCLRDLIANSELRHRFGEEGRRRAVAEFRWANIINRYEGLWRLQFEDLAAAQSEPIRTYGIDFNRVFQHFARHTLSEDLILSISPSAGVESAPPSLQRFPAEIDPDQIRRICGKLGDGPRSLGELASDCAAGAETAAYLVKRGQLRAVKAGEMNQPHKIGTPDQ
jgi:glycosyltransferase involved in cell wall biosynthesis